LFEALASLSAGRSIAEIASLLFVASEYRETQRKNALATDTFAFHLRSACSAQSTQARCALSPPQKPHRTNESGALHAANLKSDGSATFWDHGRSVEHDS
jgi:hypothetical protein